MNSLSGKFTAFVIVFVLTAGALAARPAGRNCGPGPGCGGCDGVCAAQTGSTAPLVLDDAARAALRFQLDEERMAGELYVAFGKKHAARPFTNIPRAEARHREILQQLATRAGLTVAAAAAGRYETAAIQARHDALWARGQASLIEALKVGALVEEQDIADLRALAATTDHPDLRAAVAVLERGSRHHLAAFVHNLRARGVDYEAQVLPPGELAQLISAGRDGPRHPGRPHAGRRAKTCTTAPRPV